MVSFLFSGILPFFFFFPIDAGSECMHIGDLFGPAGLLSPVAILIVVLICIQLVASCRIVNIEKLNTLKL